MEIIERVNMQDLKYPAPILIALLVTLAIVMILEVIFMFKAEKAATHAVVLMVILVACVVMRFALPGTHMCYKSTYLVNITDTSAMYDLIKGGYSIHTADDGVVTHYKISRYEP